MWPCHNQGGNQVNTDLKKMKVIGCVKITQVLSKERSTETMSQTDVGEQTFVGIAQVLVNLYGRND